MKQVFSNTPVREWSSVCAPPLAPFQKKKCRMTPLIWYLWQMNDMFKDLWVILFLCRFPIGLRLFSFPFSPIHFSPWNSEQQWGGKKKKKIFIYDLVLLFIPRQPHPLLCFHLFTSVPPSGCIYVLYANLSFFFFSFLFLCSYLIILCYSLSLPLSLTLPTTSVL